MKRFVKDANARKSGRNTAVVVLEILLLSVMIFAAVCAYGSARTKAFHVKSARIVEDPSQDGEPFELCVESVEKTKVGQGESDHLTMQGWIAERGIDADKSHITAVVRNQSTGEFFSIPTVMQNRTDVTRCLYDGCDYDNSGFKVNVRFDRNLQPDEYDYDIYLLLSTADGRYLVNTGTTINGWIEAHP